MIFIITTLTQGSLQGQSVSPPSLAVSLQTVLLWKAVFPVFCSSVLVHFLACSLHFQAMSPCLVYEACDHIYKGGEGWHFLLLFHTHCSFSGCTTHHSVEIIPHAYQDAKKDTLSSYPYVRQGPASFA